MLCYYCRLVWVDNKCTVQGFSQTLDMLCSFLSSLQPSLFSLSTREKDAGLYRNTKVKQSFKATTLHEAC